MRYLSVLAPAVLVLAFVGILGYGLVHAERGALYMLAMLAAIAAAVVLGRRR